MLDKYAPPREEWNAAKCAKVLGYRNPAAFKYAVQRGDLPQPSGYVGGSKVWLADEIRAAWIAKRREP